VVVDVKEELVTKFNEQFPTTDEGFMVKKIHTFCSSFRWELKKAAQYQKSSMYVAKKCLCQLSGITIY
jgi:hypothetical protein